MKHMAALGRLSMRRFDICLGRALGDVTERKDLRTRPTDSTDRC